MNKFNNISTINYINLESSIDRRDFMESQFTKYGITKYQCFLTTPFETYKDSCKLSGRFIDSVNHHGTNIAFLRCIKNWLDNTDEEYGIFLEDDTSFETSNYWSFTWYELIGSLPSNWDIVQLIRINDWSDGRNPQLSCRPRNWDDWGASCMIKRDYAKRLISAYLINNNEYFLDLADTNLMPIVENLLFCQYGNCLNIPLFVEGDFISTYNRGYDANHEISKQKYKDLWITNGQQTKIADLYQ